MNAQSLPSYSFTPLRCGCALSNDVLKRLFAGRSAYVRIPCPDDSASADSEVRGWAPLFGGALLLGSAPLVVVPYRRSMSTNHAGGVVVVSHAGRSRQLRRRSSVLFGARPDSSSAAASARFCTVRASSSVGRLVGWDVVWLVGAQWGRTRR